MTSISTRIKMAMTSLINPKKYQIVQPSAPLKILNAHGWMRSKESYSAIDAEGNPIPWMTYPAIEYLNQLDLSQHRVLEWGSGNSSRYFAAKSKEVISIEHNKEWYDSLKSTLAPNQKICYTELNQYAAFPLELGVKFDLIVVDGMLRKECVEQAYQLTSEGALILLDNSERYPDICSEIRRHGYFQVDFHGFGPINDYTWTTSIFISASSIGKFQPLTIQPSRPIGGENN
jgi:hypothetical protein